MCTPTCKAKVCGAVGLGRPTTTIDGRDGGRAKNYHCRGRSWPHDSYLGLFRVSLTTISLFQCYLSLPLVRKRRLFPMSWRMSCGARGALRLRPQCVSADLTSSIRAFVRAIVLPLLMSPVDFILISVTY